MMMFMIACCESTTFVFPYGRFLTEVLKDVDIDLSRGTDFEAPIHMIHMMINPWG